MSLPRLLDRVARPTLLLIDPSLVGQVGLAPSPATPAADLTVAVLPDVTVGDDHRWGCVVVALPDRAALRRTGSLPPNVGRARAVVTWLASATAPVVPDVRPEWPEVVEVDAHLTSDGAAVSRLRFRSAALVHEVLGQLGRDAGSPAVAGPGGLVVDADTSLDRTVPPDVVVVARRGEAALDPHPVTGRAPVALYVMDAPDAPDATDPADPGPVDEGVFTPAGFRRAWARGPVDLADGPVTDVTIDGLRDAQAVRVGPAVSAYDVAVLAMAGVPLVSDEPPTSLRDRLTPAVADLLSTPVDLDDALGREEHSIRLRRWARSSQSTLAWRARLGQRAGVRTVGLPSVSVLLATRRPELLPFALAQVAKQREPVELVLAAHGFTPDAGVVRAHLGDRPVVVRSVPAQTRFGDVVAGAAAAASGDVVLKMDDDDWYGPDVVSDLLWARRQSGADLVGMPAEFVYLEPVGVTVRRRGGSECPGRVVAGGTMMLERGYLREIGGFRSVTRFVDAQLFAAVRAAGGQVYRAQGLGYVLRRTSSGHTWNTDLGYFLRRGTVVAQWRGFRPSRLLGYDESERPTLPQAAT